jgi:hypothetical protein
MKSRQTAKRHKNRVFSDQKFYAELKKVYFMRSEMQPGVMRAQKREIQISHVKQILYLV